ncbi:MAG: hypothetical protein IKV36_01865 [Clostridia bacterium]|nr:hypothetical protein [Clostridia bacterium]
MAIYNPFIIAKPVWAKGLADEMNCTLGFYKKINTNGKATLKIATGGFYRLLVNGEFKYYGPARAPHGFYRVDELEIDLPQGEVHLALEVINHRAESYGIISNPAFLTAEIIADGKLVAATGSDKDFDCYILTHRVKKVQRYGFQRPFSEGYRLNRGFADWAVGKEVPNAHKTDVEICEQKVYIERNIRHHDFFKTLPKSLVSKGSVKIEKPESYYRHFSWTDAGKTELQGYKFEDLEFSMSDEAQELKNDTLTECNSPAPDSFSLKEKDFHIFSLVGERTGFISLKIDCKKAGSLYITFDEILSDGDVSSYRMDCCNVIRLDLEQGVHDFCSMECYGFKFIKFTAKTGDFDISGLHLKEYVCPEPLCDLYKSEDEDINLILEAAKQSFLQNSADMFMDCPTRERAGWLCDSFFLGRSEYYFTGANKIEHNYLENYLLPEKYPNVPDGMVPMCYPSDHGANSFIPNWAMWFIIELEEHKNRTCDFEFISRFESKIKGILDWFAQHENADGLLEKVPGWVFVEWSAANSFTKDINFPTNMLYAKTLDAASRLLGRPELSCKAEKLREVIRKRSFDGEFFVDNEVYADGLLTKTTNRTETCQYYAFFTGVATPETHPELWRKLVEDFGPDRAKGKNKYPDIHPSNAFIGNYLRLMLLDENRLYEQLLDESKGYFLYMAERTCTLWEFISTEASCNHGFASYTACMIKNASEALK